MRTRIMTQLVAVAAFLVSRTSTTDERAKKKGSAGATVKAIGCPSGSIIGRSVRQITINSKQPCLIISVAVEQGIQAQNSSAIIMVEVSALSPFGEHPGNHSVHGMRPAPYEVTVGRQEPT